MAMDLQMMFSIEMALDRNFDRNFQKMDSRFVQTMEKMKGLNAQSQNLSGLSSMAQKFQALTGKSTETQASLSDLAARQQNLIPYIESNAAHTANLTSRYDRLKAAAAQLKESGQGDSDTFRSLQERMKKLKPEIKGAKEEGARLAEIQKNLTREGASLQQQAEKEAQSLAEMQSALKAAGVNTNDLASEQDRLQRELAESQAAQEKLSNAQNKFSKYREKLSWNNVKGEVMGSLGTIKMLEAPVKTMMDFEQAMANVRAVNGADDVQFNMLRDQALELGRTTQFSASQAANTQETLARGGFNPKQIVDAMPSVLAMAAAEGMELSQAGDIIVKTLGGMGYKDENGNIDTTQSARVADVLANMSASSATNIAELGEGMKVAAPVFSSLGTTIEQVGAYLGGMANKGFTGSEAGTALASSVMRLSKLPKDTYNALADLGVATRTKEGKLREFPDIMKAINSAFKAKGFGEAQQLEYMTKIFGQNQGKAMAALMEASVSGQIDTLEASNREKAQGKAQSMSDIRNNTLVGDLAGLSSAWESFMISVGKPLEDWTRNIVQGITQAINWVTQFMREHEKLADIVVKVVAGFGALKVAFSVYNISKNVAGLVGSFFQLRSAAAAANVAMQGASGAGGIFSSIGAAAKGAWAVVAAHPFVAIGAAVAAAGVLIYQNWDEIKDYAAKTWQSVKEYASSAASWCSEKWQGVSDWWNSWSISDVFAPVSGYASAVSASVSEKWQAVSDWFSSWELPNIFEGLGNFATSAIDSIKGMFSGFGDWIMDTIGKLNPFTWELPSWLGGSGGSSAPAPEAKQGSNNRGTTSAPTTGYHGVRRHAFGGILTTPHIGMVAEAGPEAIIPLRDKSRGQEVLLQAASILGVPADVNVLSPMTSAINSSNNLSDFAQNVLAQDVKGNNLSDFAQNVKENIDNNRLFDTFGGNNYSNNSNTNNFGQPQINITVNSSGNNDNNEDLAAMIARKVQEAWQDIQERQVRLAYA